MSSAARENRPRDRFGPCEAGTSISPAPRVLVPSGLRIGHRNDFLYKLAISAFFHLPAISNHLYFAAIKSSTIQPRRIRRLVPRIIVCRVETTPQASRSDLPIIDGRGYLAMRNLRCLLRILALALVTAAGGGCCCQSSHVPVDLEEVCRVHRFHGVGCWHYPHSCPPCPYYDLHHCQWRAPDWEVAVCAESTAQPGESVPTPPTSTPPVAAAAAAGPSARRSQR